MNGHISVCSLLLGRSTHQLAIKDSQGRTGLHIAAAHGHLELVTLLLGQGAEINVLDQVCDELNTGYNLTHFFCLKQYIDIGLDSANYETFPMTSLFL